MKIESVSVSLGDRSYKIHVGAKLLESAPQLLKPYLSPKGAIVVTDKNVMAAQGSRLEKALADDRVKSKFIVIEPGETAKSFSQLEKLLNQLLGLGVERNDLIIAFGGGVVGDLTGFAASILRRGCKYAQIPTSLLAQVDSSIGGKTAINSDHGKNLVGAFYQPEIVVADVSTLSTLPSRELRAGYAEIVKYALINDPEFFDWLEANGSRALSDAGVEELIYSVTMSCKAKASIVSEDEFEHGKRALLNLGHTFGHALEAAQGYTGALIHGEAVAIGICLAFEYAERTGLCRHGETSRVEAHFKSIGLATTVAEASLPSETTGKTLSGIMMQDKKVQDGKLRLVLPESIGSTKIVSNVNFAEIESYLNIKLSEAGF